MDVRLTRLKLSTVFGLIAIILTACGGGAGEGGEDNSGGGNIDISRTILVSVSDSSGPIDIRVNEQDITLEVDGSIELDGFQQDDVVQATILDQTVGDNCYFSPVNQQQILVNNRVTIECGASQVSGTLKDFFNNSVIANADITVTASDGATSELIATTTTDDSGVFTVDTGTLERFVVTATAGGYATYSRVINLTPTRPVAVENIFMVPRVLSDDEDPTSDMVFRISGINVLEIPANGLQTSSGAAPGGAVTATLAILDPSASPAILPGQYQAFTGGLISRVESFGGLSVSISDSSGNILELANGVEATVAVPSPISSGVTVATPSIYSFDSATGFWESEVAAVESSFGATKIFTASVDELANTFMAGRSYTDSNVGGVVVDSLGNPFAGVPVIAQGQDYYGLSWSVTDSSGNFLLPAKSGESVFVYALAGAQSRTVAADVGAAPMDLEVLLERDSTVITLTWGEDPRDLDSQLFGPTSTSGERFHVYFGNSEETVGGQTIFLDVDDVTSFGPEVTTIPSFPLPGIYEFYVDLFSGESTIQDSPARVELNLQGSSFAFSPPGGFPTECWHVFDISVDSSLRGTLVEQNDWVSDEACSSGLQ